MRPYLTGTTTRPETVHIFTPNNLPGVAGRQSPIRSIVPLNSLWGGKITNLTILIKQRTYQPLPSAKVAPRSAFRDNRGSLRQVPYLPAEPNRHNRMAPYHAYHSYHAPFPSAALGRMAPYHAYHSYHAPFPSAASGRDGTLPRIPLISRTISVGRLRPRWHLTTHTTHITHHFRRLP